MDYFIEHDHIYSNQPFITKVMIAVATDTKIGTRTEVKIKVLNRFLSELLYRKVGKALVHIVL